MSVSDQNSQHCGWKYLSLVILLHTIHTWRNLSSKQVRGDVRQAPIPIIPVAKGKRRSIRVSYQCQCHSIKLIALKNSTRSKWMSLGSKKKTRYPWVTKFWSDFIMDLLMLSQDGTHHYVSVTDSNHFVNFIKKTQSRLRDEICWNCFHVCNSIESLENNCYENEAAIIFQPDKKKRLQRCENTKATCYVPLVIHFDTEALLVPIHTCASAPNASRQMKFEKHIAFGYAFFIIENGNDKLLSTESKENTTVRKILSKKWKK